MTTDTVGPHDAAPMAGANRPLLTGGWQYVAAVGVGGVISGLVSAAVGRLWTVPVDSCGYEGRAGTQLGWALAWGAGLVMLAMAVAVIVAVIGAIAGQRHWWRVAAMCVGWTMACGTTFVLGVMSNFGDTPLFCF